MPLLSNKFNKMNVPVPETNNKYSIRYLVSTVSLFSALILSLTWRDFISSTLALISKKAPILSLFGGFIAALIVTALVIAISVAFLNHLAIKKVTGEKPGADEEDDSES